MTSLKTNCTTKLTHLLGGTTLTACAPRARSQMMTMCGLMAIDDGIERTSRLPVSADAIRLSVLLFSGSPRSRPSATFGTFSLQPSRPPPTAPRASATPDVLTARAPCCSQMGHRADHPAAGDHALGGADRRAVGLRPQLQAPGLRAGRGGALDHARLPDNVRRVEGRLRRQRARSRGRSGTRAHRHRGAHFRDGPARRRAAGPSRPHGWRTGRGIHWGGGWIAALCVVVRRARRRCARLLRRPGRCRLPLWHRVGGGNCHGQARRGRGGDHAL